MITATTKCTIGFASAHVETHRKLRRQTFQQIEQSLADATGFLLQALPEPDTGGLELPSTEHGAQLSRDAETRIQDATHGTAVEGSGYATGGLSRLRISLRIWVLNHLVVTQLIELTMMATTSLEIAGGLLRSCSHTTARHPRT